MSLPALGKRTFGAILADPPWRFTNRTGKVAPEHARLKRYATMKAFDIREPLRTVVAQGQHHALINCRVEQVRAFLFRYYGSGGQWNDLRDPAPTITARDRLALGIVRIGLDLWQIVDIGMRMLTPRELFRAQGFPDDYEITVGYDGRPVTKTAQVARCGNSVCPHPAEALVRANLVTT